MLRGLCVDKINNIILFFLCLFLLGEYNEHITSVKNIGIYGALTFLVVAGVLDFGILMKNFKRNFVNNRILIVFFVLFVFYASVVSIFPYDTSYGSFASMFKSLKRSFIFIIIIMFCHNESNKIYKWFLYSMILALTFDNMHFFIKSIESNCFNFEALNQSKVAIIDRFYSSFVDKLFIFSLPPNNNHEINSTYSVFPILVVPETSKIG